MTAAGGTIGTSLEPYYSGGVVLDHEDPSIVYLSRQTGGGGYDIEKWITPDGGRTWESHAITSASTRNVRPVVPRHHSPDLEALWVSGDYRFPNRYDTGIEGYPALTAPGDAKTSSR
jgi:hypothetical protein